MSERPPNPTDDQQSACNCRRCLRERGDQEMGLPVEMVRFIVCAICGNKRCPHATDCQFDCTHSNETGQIGSVYQ